MKRVLIVCASALVSTLAFATPSRMNYQGALLDSSGAPVTGDRDMEFHFFNTFTPGPLDNELLVDTHFAGGAGPVNVSTGLFNALLGGGFVTDGSGPGTYASLSDVFRDFNTVFLEIRVRQGAAGGAGSVETLAPRVQIQSSAFAMNSGLLEGLASASFLRSDAPTAVLSGNSLSFGTGSELYLDGGDASVPGMGFSADFDTGIFQPGDNQLAFATGGVEAMRIGASGDVLSTHTIVVGDATPADGQLFSSFGEASGKHVAQVNGPSDVYVAGNIEVDGTVYGGAQVQAGSGTAAAPSFAFTSAPNTGWYAPAGNRVSLSLSGLDVFDIFPNGDMTSAGRLFLGCSSATTCPGTQSIQFNAAAGNSWTFFAPIQTGSTLEAGGAPLATPSPFNRFGSTGTPTLGSINNGSDLFVSDSLEAGGLFKVDGQIIEGQTTALAGVRALQLISDSSMAFMVDANNNDNGSDTFEWWQNGNFAATANKLADLAPSGNLRIRGSLVSGVMFDLAEAFIKSESVEPGDVVSVDPSRNNAVVLSRGEGDSRVLGVVSTRPGVVLGGAIFGREDLAAWGPDLARRFETEEPRIRKEMGLSTEDAREPGLASDQALRRFADEALTPVALSGRVPVKVDTQFGAIQAGDLLAPSPIPGVAMKALKPGPVIGTALESFAGGRGTVLTFIHRESGGSPTALPVEAPAALQDSRSPAQQPAQRSEIVPAPLARGLAELHPVSETVEAGDVVVADRGMTGSLRKGSTPSDPAVVGIVASEPGLVLGSGMDPTAAAGTQAAVVLSGTVPCKADATFGAIHAGDLLAVSPTPGHAMLSPDGKAGTILGKALEPLESGTGVIQVLVMLH